MKLAFTIFLIWIEFFSVLSWVTNAHTMAEYYMKSRELNNKQQNENNKHYEEFPDFTDTVYVPGIHDDTQKTNDIKIPITSFQNKTSLDSSSEQNKTYNYENNTEFFDYSNKTYNQGTFVNETEHNIENQTEIPKMNETLYPEEDDINRDGNETKQIDKNKNIGETNQDISNDTSEFPFQNLSKASIPQTLNESINNNTSQDLTDMNEEPHLSSQNTSSSYNSQPVPIEEEPIYSSENITHSIIDKNNNVDIHTLNQTNENHQQNQLEEKKEKKSKHHHHKKKKLNDYQNEIMQKMFDNFLQYTNQLIQNKTQMEQEKLKNDTKTIIITSSTDTKIDSKNENINYSHNKIIITPQPKKVNRKKLK